MYKKLKKDDLVEQCKKRGLDHSGLKADLIERLIAADAKEKEEEKEKEEKEKDHPEEKAEDAKEKEEEKEKEVEKKEKEKKRYPQDGLKVDHIIGDIEDESLKQSVLMFITRVFDRYGIAWR